MLRDKEPGLPEQGIPVLIFRFSCFRGYGDNRLGPFQLPAQPGQVLWLKVFFIYRLFHRENRPQRNPYLLRRFRAKQVRALGQGAQHHHRRMRAAGSELGQLPLHRIPQRKGIPHPWIQVPGDSNCQRYLLFVHMLPSHLSGVAAFCHFSR